MKNRSETFFTKDEIEKIVASIKEAESRSSGEIVTMVVDQSDSYRDIDVLSGITASAMISIYPAQLFFVWSDIILRKFIPSLNWYTAVPDGTRFITGLIIFISLTIVLHFPFKALFRKLSTIKRLIISAKRINAEVKERALRGFQEHGLGKTREGTGVLFLISVFEKKVQVLADHGIYTKIDQKKLDALAGSIAKGMVSGNGVDALCLAINEIGTELAKHFPRSPDDKNELSDHVITEK